jgi:hypothetical protein
LETGRAPSNEEPISLPEERRNESRAADLDGDRNLDLVLPITTGNAVAILFGDGEGRFAAPRLFPVVGGPFMAVVADFACRRAP